MKKSIILASTLLLCACGPTKIDPKHVVPETKYRLSINTTLQSRCPAEAYLTSEKLNDLVTNTIKQHFCALEKCTESTESNSEIIDLNLNINFTRTIANETFYCSDQFGGMTISYSYKFSKDNAILLNANSGARIFDRGLLGNLKRMGSNLTWQTGPQEEIDDVKGISQAIAKDLINRIPD